MKFAHLQQGNVETWTFLIRRNRRLKESLVTQVDITAGPEGSWRAAVHLSTQQDPLGFLLKPTSAAAAHFYSSCARQIPFLLPGIWYVADDGEEDGSWVVLEDVEPGIGSADWSLPDLDKVARQLATVHAIFWQPRAADHGWLPFALGHNGRGLKTTQNGLSRSEGPYNLVHRLLTDQGEQPSYPILDTDIVQKTRGLWPDLLQERHFQALKHLMREPYLLFRPLLTLPLTIIHGDPNIERWRLTLFGNTYLLDWSTIALGPAAFDLDLLISSIPPLARPNRSGRPTPWSLAYESVLDSYFVALSENLHERHGYGVVYSGRYMRRFALPAARCWLILNRHLPRLLDHAEDIEQNDVDELWSRFLDSYRLLTTYVQGMSEITIR